MKHCLSHFLFYSGLISPLCCTGWNTDTAWGQYVDMQNPKNLVHGLIHMDASTCYVGEHAWLSVRFLMVIEYFIILSKVSIKIRYKISEWPHDKLVMALAFVLLLFIKATLYLTSIYILKIFPFLHCSL